jgi:hypothetical protein
MSTSRHHERAPPPLSLENLLATRWAKVDISRGLPLGPFQCLHQIATAEIKLHLFTNVRGQLFKAI